VRKDSRYSRLKNRFWTDEKSASWDDATKLLALYLLSSPHINIVGCYVLPKGYICEDLGWSAQKLQKSFTKLQKDDFILYDGEVRLVLVKNYLKHNPIENPNQANAVLAVIKELPKSPLLDELKRLLEPFSKLFTEPLLQPLEEPFDKPVTVTVTETVTDTVTETKKENTCADDEPDKKSFTFTYSEDFENFWSIYPRRIEKRRAYRAWQARLKEGTLPDLLITCAQNYEKYVRLRGTEERYIKHPATFLGPDHPYEDWKEPPPDSSIPKMGNVAAGLMKWADEHEKEEKRK